MNRKKQPSIAEVKAAARGQWATILQDAGLPRDCLDSRGQPCPKCGGVDRYNAAKDVEETGKVFCRKCFGDKTGQIRPGDGVATVAWFNSISNGEAAKWIADRLGLCGTSKPNASVDIITATARDKRMPVAAFKLFGVKKARRGREGLAVCRIDLYNDIGRVHSYFDLWPGDKGRVKKGSGMSGLFFPGRLPKAGETWLAVEGVKDAAALVGMGFNAFGIVGNKLASKYTRLFEGVDVVVVPDLDTAGKVGADTTASNLSGIASKVSVARLPGSIKEKGGDDVRDVLRKPNGEKLVRESIEFATPWKPSEADDDDALPKVKVTLNEAAVADEVVKYLGKLGWESPWIIPGDREAVRVYTRGGVLVHTVESDDVDAKGRSSIRDLPPSLTRERITQAVSLIQEVERDDGVEAKPLRPPKWLIDAVCKRGSYGGKVRSLSAIVASPTIRADGSVLQTQGYDQKTGLIFRSSIAFPEVPESPTKDDAARALSALLEVLADFPMVEDADHSAWVAMVLSMIGRPCIEGYVPLFAITANTRGAGKSLLADAATLIAYGRRAARKVFTADDDEMRKTITAVALDAAPAVLFDNLDGQLRGSALDAAITSATWSDRILGQSRMTGDLPMRTVWSATGNNMAYGSDVGRRVLQIRLQSPLERPENRTGFTHPDLLSWIGDQRASLAVAALTILRAYFVAGCPVQPNGDWGSFESWSAKIRGAIVWAGGACPLPTRPTADAGDDTAELLGKLINGIEQADPSGRGLTAQEIKQKTIGSQANDIKHQALAEVAHEICGEGFDCKQFGRWMGGLRGRVQGSKSIDSESAGGGVKRWFVRSHESGSSGSSFP